ncbi:MAG: rhomboid family intramembrane serine protease [Candidatus Syntrophonatronum acetioxidans]|uniref:Rhomboid family intramembrane serine protease n=1 Tax=Candidatus Syntrophonatronum acetioxidans TaxID=1795816 RepID=A0A424YES4_9FIRM|nr:MAG: rhomboid family intramembrane serine protease [Candidatus Syntrophonatronum acetioxidans]
MIPLKDNIRPRRFPLVNKTLIGINVAVFLYQVLLTPQGVQELVFTFGVVPRQITGLTPGDLVAAGFIPLLPLVTATFLHGGWLHLIGNMLYLWVFGDNIEDCLGPVKYLFAYIVMGMVGHFSHIIFDPFSPVPLIGASGAIAGVLGAYFILYPWAKVLTLLPLGIFFTFVEIPAVIFLFLWFFIQVASGVAELVMSPQMQVIAWWAHVGGFISGVAAGIFIKRRKLCQ